MTPPTRTQIEATITQPTYQVSYWAGGMWHAISGDDVERADPQHTSSDDLHGIAFGASVGASCTITVADTPSLRALAWQLMPIRVRFGFAASDLIDAFVGPIMRMQRNGDTITWECAGLDELMRGTPVFSPMLYRRLAATKTTTISNELTNGGIVNYILWTCGGRPVEQQGNYPNAVFYYTCHDALIAPEWAWVAGENAWDELQRLCLTVGGQIVQRPDGIVSYVNPLYFGYSTGIPYTFESSTFQALSLSGGARDTVASVRMRVTVRALQGEQTVYEDTTPRYVPAGGVVTAICDMAVPVYTYGETNISITDIWGNAIPPSVIVTQMAAARATVQITNTSTLPAVVSRIALRGRPVLAVSDEQVIIGSGTPQLELGSDAEALLQSVAHANMLGTIYTSFYGVPRPIITLSACGYDPDRTVGERCVLHDPDAGFTYEPVRIVALQVSETGATMDVDVVSVAGLPTLDQFFLVDGTYTETDQRYVGY